MRVRQIFLDARVERSRMVDEALPPAGPRTCLAIALGQQPLVCHMNWRPTLDRRAARADLVSQDRARHAIEAEDMSERRPDMVREIVVNGEAVRSGAATLDAILAELGYAGRKVATALNGNFVPAARRSETTLTAGDRIEIVAPRQGG